MPLKEKQRIIVVGSSNTDLVVECDALPRPGETVPGGSLQRYLGGKGANQAVAAANAGDDVIFIGDCGDDDFGREAKEGLDSAGIDLNHFITRPDVPSGVALILVGGCEKENIIAVTRSANDTLTAEDVMAARSSFTDCSAVLCQLEIPLEAIETAAELALQNSVPFILNPAPARKLSQKLLCMVHTLTPNKHEAVSLTGISDVPKAAARLCEMGCSHVVVTQGEKGALLVDRKKQIQVPAPSVEVVDTVGAGDAFTAYYTVGIAEGMDETAAVERAVRAASLSVTRLGAQPSMPLLSEVA
jgi:ribokinase